MSLNAPSPLGASGVQRGRAHAWGTHAFMRCLLAPLVAGVLLGGCSSPPKSFHPERPISPESFSHEALDGVFRTHVAGGHVDYPGVAADPRFEAYLTQLNRVNPDELPTQEARLAFWIDAYNAFAVKGILDGYSPDSLFGRYRYFVARDYRVGGEEINLFALEQHLLIPEFHEPRIHFAIVCASKSCPELRSGAYTAEDLESQLDGAARAFINDPARNRFDRVEKVAHLSRIFEWFEEDFVAESGSLPAYVAQFVEDRELARDLKSPGYEVQFLEYDWRLNGTPPTDEVRHARVR